MISLFVAGLAVLVFAIILAVSRIGKTAGSAVKLCVDGVSAIFDRDLTDDEKEAKARQSAIALLAASWGIAWRLAAALGGAALPIYLVDFLGFSPAGDVIALMLRLDFIIIVSVALVAGVYLLKRLRAGTEGPAKEHGENAYSAGDRMVHVLAFSSPGVMKRLAGADARLAGASLDRFEYGPPLFVTSLARGGTTALLNALAGEPRLCSFLYRDMPFPTAPVLWSRLSRSSREVVLRKRAHGDGLEIGLDSPEAFDEVLWMLGWPGKYQGDRIGTWSPSDADEGARNLLEKTFRRVCYLRARERGAADGTRLHYLSKNNANIARISLLGEMFPGASVVVVLRHPGAHALSLWRQHQRFGKIHAEEEFTKRYMRDIGHFEFGALHRPIAFEGLGQAAQDPDTPDYWLGYWIAAFRHIAAERARCILVAQDRLRSAPDATMGALFERTGLTPSQQDFSGFFHAHPDTFDRSRFSTGLLDEAETLFADLEASSV